MKKENFNFINGEDEIDLNWLKSGLDEDLIRSQIAKLEQYKYSPDFNVRFYDEVNEELDVLEKQLEAAHEWNDLFLMIEYTMENYGVKTYVKLDVNLPNQEIWVPKLTKLYISKGIDGYKTGCVYTIFNFDKLNNDNVKMMAETSVSAIFVMQVKKYPLNGFYKKKIQNISIKFNIKRLYSRKIES